MNADAIHSRDDCVTVCVTPCVMTASLEVTGSTDNSAAQQSLYSTPEYLTQLHPSVSYVMLTSYKGSTHAFLFELQYYTPAILALAGFRDKRTALLVAMLPAAVNSVGTLVGMWQIDKCGRRQAWLPSSCLHTFPFPNPLVEHIVVFLSP